jgi:hypothetical protein
VTRGPSEGVREVSRGICRLLPTAGERVRKAAEETDGEVAPRGRPAKETGILPVYQEQRAARNGVGVRTQRQLDRLARDFPDLHGKVCSGDMSCHQAAVKAGFVKENHLAVLKRQGGGKCLHLRRPHR